MTASTDDPWLGCNPFDPEFRRQPHAPLRRLREIDPVNLTPMGAWRLCRHADVEHLLKRVACGVRLPTGQGLPLPTALPDNPRDRFMLVQDPPVHTRLRRLVSHAFTPRAVDRLRGRVAEIVDEQLDRAAEAGRMDVVSDLAYPVPSILICELLGVPVADRGRFTRWTTDATHGLDMGASPEWVARSDAATLALVEYFEALIAERRAHLGEDLLSTLIRAEEEGDRLSTPELVSQSIGLLIAGFETTIGLIGNGVKALLDHPGELAKLRARPEAIGTTVAECLRYEGPILFTGRFLHEDATFGEKTIPAGSLVVAMLAAANRDPEAFADPETFRIDRPAGPLRHFAFGGGAHTCLGAHLAELEAQLAIGKLVERFASIEQSGDTTWSDSFFRVLGSLPVGLKS